MSEMTMPAAEAAPETALDERTAYELAFHVLPTVAEGEVAGVFDAIKDQITKLGGEITNSEDPQRFELAYEIEKHLEGRNRRFKSAYFGWVRFSLDSDKVDALVDHVETRGDILRHLLIKLSRAEEATPFFFHEALNEDQKVQDIDIKDIPDADDSSEESDDTKEEAKEEEKSEEEEK